MSFKEAIDFLKQKVPMTKGEFERLDKCLRFRAFAVARLTQLDAINAVKEKLQKVLEEGKSFKEFWEEGGKDELLRRAGFHESNPWYWESMFRTNIQSAYNAGRAMQIRRTRVPYLEFVGIRDSRQTEICRARSGVIRPADDPWWKNNWPPLHIGCRSTVRPVYQEEKEAFGFRLTRTDALERFPPPQEGFGGNPLDTGSFYRLTSRMIERAKQYGI